MTYLLDSDLNGTDSIQFLIDAGYVKHIPCPTYQDFDAAVKWLVRFAEPTDIVVLDTISQQAFVTRGDAKLGTDLEADLWERRSLFLDGDKNYLTVYDMAGQFIMRRLRNLRARGIRLITTAHEDDQTEGAIRKSAPQMNKALYDSLRSATSDVFRLWVLHQPIIDPTTRQTLYPAGTRVVQIKPTDGAVAKYHTSPFVTDNLPGNVPIPSVMTPTLPTVYNVIGKLPSWLCLYGQQGSGKTTAAVSEAFYLYLQHNPHNPLQRTPA